jgi:hypothetical protein
MCTRNAVAGSWVASSPARSADPEPDPPERYRAEHPAQLQQPLEHRLVDGVAADRVAQLVGDHEAHLVLVEQLQQRGVQHDERLVHPDGHRVGERVVADVHLRQLLHVQHASDVGQHLVQLLELSVVDPHRRSQEQQPDRTLVEESRHRLQEGVETLELPQRHESATVGGVLPGA